MIGAAVQLYIYIYIHIVGAACQLYICLHPIYMYIGQYSGRKGIIGKKVRKLISTLDF